MKREANRHDCDLVDAWVDDWIHGRIPPDLAQRLDAHVALCDRCRRLVSIVRGEEEDNQDVPVLPSNRAGPAESAFKDVQDLLPGVMARTTGGSCARAEEQLPALVDGKLDPAGREVLREHLAHCRKCSTMLAILEESGNLLPSLAEMKTPPGFVEQVLAKTSERSGGRALGEWWLRVLARPRASLELAYVGTLLIVVLVGNPIAAVRGVTAGASRLRAKAPQIAEQLTTSGAATSVMSRSERLVAWFSATAGNLISSVHERLEEVRTLVAAVSSNVRAVFRWVLSLDIGRWLHLVQPARSQPPPANPESQVPGPPNPRSR
jgi:anti-sigma factor RsiW